jgi:hypothetical protein
LCHAAGGTLRLREKSVVFAFLPLVHKLRGHAEGEIAAERRYRIAERIGVSLGDEPADDTAFATVHARSEREADEWWRKVYKPARSCPFSGHESGA